MKIAVYCGSGTGNKPNVISKTVELGNWIGKNGHTLIYGGGDEGLMGIIAKTVYKYGNEVIGVLPGNVDFIANRTQSYCTQVIKASNMNVRKQTMLEMADVFIALPGGIGTLDEISEAITLTKIGVFDKPCILYDVDEFYQGFKSFLETMIQSEFLRAAEIKKVLFSQDVDEIEQFIRKG
ncbi:MAG: TIGR00730 family Rossman fold protein [Firmicutes bacterium]|nr:TIGR00730 family Rossman fold protein [Bacillota bacterium]